METTFNFSDPTTEYIYSLHPKSEILLHIKRNTKSMATLYFTNQLNIKIDIPSDFTIYQNTKNKNRKIIKYPNENKMDEYTLYWNRNYDIVYNGETLYNIRNEKTWTIYN
jgi:hypothetical protein